MSATFYSMESFLITLDDVSALQIPLHHLTWDRKTLISMTTYNIDNKGNGGGVVVGVNLVSTKAYRDISAI